MSKDQRLSELKRWLQGYFKDTSFELTPASEDASFRRYFRVTHNDKTYIAMDAPPPQEDIYSFSCIAKVWQHTGIHVPKIYAEDIDTGFMLLSDFGDTLYLDALQDAENTHDLYKAAINALIKIQLSTSSELTLPPYDRALLAQETSLFGEWYLSQHLQIEMTAKQQQILDDACDMLIASALEQPTVWVHRDYHSRNLMVTPQNNPGILDFQDAVIGPISYDLVSLLRDCYISWPEDAINDWCNYYCKAAITNGLLRPEDKIPFRRWFDLMGIQRHLKAIGIFSRLCHRDGKSSYVNDIPRTLRYIFDISKRYSELAVFRKLLTDLIPVDEPDNNNH